MPSRARAGGNSALAALYLRTLKMRSLIALNTSREGPIRDTGNHYIIEKKRGGGGKP